MGELLWVMGQRIAPHNQAWECFISFLKIPQSAVSWSFSPWMEPCSPVLWLLPFLSLQRRQDLFQTWDEVKEINTVPTDSGIFFLKKAWMSRTAQIRFAFILCCLLSFLIYHMEKLVASTSDVWGKMLSVKYLESRKHAGMESFLNPPSCKLILPACSPEQLTYFGLQRTWIIFTLLHRTLKMKCLPSAWILSMLSEFGIKEIPLNGKDNSWSTFVFQLNFILKKIL